MKMTKNEEFNWKPIIVKGLVYLFGIPLSIVACALFGFMIIGLFFIIPNFIAGILDWVINGTYPFVEIIKWNIIWTRLSIVLGIIIAIGVLISIFETNDSRGLLR